jgi:hypothetical protein
VRNILLALSYHCLTSRCSADGSGEGPTRAVFIAAAKHLIATQSRIGLWQEVNGWLVPKLSPAQDGPQSSERLLEFRLAGMLFALHIMILRYPVPKISPHIILHLLSGSCPPDLVYLRQVDPSAANILAPWFEYINNETSANNPVPPSVRHLLAEYLNEPVSLSLSSQHSLLSSSFRSMP